MREWEIGAVENIHGALTYIQVAPILALVGVGVNRIGKNRTPKLVNTLSRCKSASDRNETFDGCAYHVRSWGGGGTGLNAD